MRHGEVAGVVRAFAVERPEPGDEILPARLRRLRAPLLQERRDLAIVRLVIDERARQRFDAGQLLGGQVRRGRQRRQPGRGMRELAPDRHAREDGDALTRARQLHLAIARPRHTGRRRAATAGRAAAPPSARRYPTRR